MTQKCLTPMRFAESRTKGGGREIKYMAFNGSTDTIIGGFFVSKPGAPESSVQTRNGKLDGQNYLRPVARRRQWMTTHESIGMVDPGMVRVMFGGPGAYDGGIMSLNTPDNQQGRP